MGKVDKEDFGSYLEKLRRDLDENMISLFLEHLGQAQRRQKEIRKRNENDLHKFHGMQIEMIKNVLEKTRQLEKSKKHESLILRRLYQRYLIKLVESYLDFCPQNIYWRERRMKYRNDYFNIGGSFVSDKKYFYNQKQSEREEATIKMYLVDLEMDVEGDRFDLFSERLEEQSLVIDKWKREHNVYRLRLRNIYWEAIRKMKENWKILGKSIIYQKYFIKIINSYLMFWEQCGDAKREKNKVVNDFLNREGTFVSKKINYHTQINEIRITNDLKYINYCIEKVFSKRGELGKMLYFLTAKKIFETDSKEIDRKIRLIKRQLKVKRAYNGYEFEFPKGSLLILDSNVVLDVIIGEKSGQKRNIKNDFKKFKMYDNSLVLLRCSLEEIENGIKGKIMNASSGLKESMEAKYFGELEELKKNFVVEDVNFNEGTHIKVRDFYMSYISDLEYISRRKMSREEKATRKLRKLAQREFFLPEHKDLELFNNVLELKEKKNKPVFIYTSDDDFTQFKREIYRAFGVKIISPRKPRKFRHRFRV